MLYWFLPYIICSYSRIWPYLVSVTDNEDFELNDRGLLDDNVSASVNTQENHCGTNKNHGKISHVSTPSTSLLIYYFVPSSIPLLSAIQCYKGEGSGLAIFGLRALKGRRSLGGW
jgi:hypothetical protein